jgi:hypothetical protein
MNGDFQAVINFAHRGRGGMPQKRRIGVPTGALVGGQGFSLETWARYLTQAFLLLT